MSHLKKDPLLPHSRKTPSASDNLKEHQEIFSKELSKELKEALIIRSLGLKHKLRVHESAQLPESHAEQALYLAAKWELEDELKAIENLISELRLENVNKKRDLILKHGVKNQHPSRFAPNTQKSAEPKDTQEPSELIQDQPGY